MKNRNPFKIFFLVALTVGLCLQGAAAQASSTAPKQEKLLNGLKILMWSDAKADKVSVKIRVHSGSAFDPQGKEGVMQMLADNIFPTEATREYFKDDLGGDLEIVTNYDFIQINASSKPEGFLQMLETLSTAVSNPAIDRETTLKVRNALLAKVATMEADPAYVADQAVAKRLFGTFPYGRPQLGTAESLKKIDFADLIDAKGRFLTADNATIAISGNFDSSLAFKAVRRYFGSWLKADKKTPSTFKQPDEPLTAALKIPSPKPEVAALRFAVRGSARSDKDLAASKVFAAIIESRLKARVTTGYADTVSVSNQAHVLPGMIVIGMTAARNVMGDTNGKNDADDMIAKVLTGPFSASEFDAAWNEVRREWAGQDVASLWLDADTFRIEKPDAYSSALNSVVLADIDEYAQRIRKLPMVIVAVTSPGPVS